MPVVRAIVTVVNGIVSIHSDLLRALLQVQVSLRIKSGNPDWSAGVCMKHCRELVYGSKRQCFYGSITTLVPLRHIA